MLEQQGGMAGDSASAEGADGRGRQARKPWMGQARCEEDEGTGVAR